MSDEITPEEYRAIMMARYRAALQRARALAGDEAAKTSVVDAFAALLPDDGWDPPTLPDEVANLLGN